MGYPNVECGKHEGSPKPGYVICPHEGRMLRERPSSSELGVLVCDDCDTMLIVGNIDGMVVACADCVANEVQDV